MKIYMMDIKESDLCSSVLDSKLIEKSDFAIAAADGDELCGIIAAALEETCYRINYIYVSENFRDQGVASLMLEALKELAVDSDIDGILVSVPEKTGENSVSEMFSYLGFETLGEGDELWSLKLQDLAGLTTENKSDIMVISMKDAPTGYFRRIQTALLEREKDENEKALPILKSIDSYDPSTSVYVKKDGKLTALFFEDFGEEGLLLSFVLSEESNSPETLICIFAHAFKAIYSEELKQLPVLINTLEGRSQALIKKLSGNKAEHISTVVNMFYPL